MGKQRELKTKPRTWLSPDAWQESVFGCYLRELFVTVAAAAFTAAAVAAPARGNAERQHGGQRENRDGHGQQE